MKKFFCFLLFCALVSSACGMKRAEPDGGFDGENSAAAKRQRPLKFVWEPEYRVVDDAYRVIEKNADRIVSDVKEALALGDDPNGTSENRPLCHAVGLVGCAQAVKLLLAYGADPDLVSSMGKPLECVVDFEAAQLLIRAGANVKNLESGVLAASLCDNDDPSNLRSLVWILDHGVDPNIGGCFDSVNFNIGFAIHFALLKRSLEKVIALVQYGARLDVGAGELLAFAENIFAEDLGEDFGPLLYAYAQYEFLKAFGEHKLKPGKVYEIEEYKAMGISAVSAGLIRAATEEVNKIALQCALEDLQYNYGEQSIVRFLKDRELGILGKHKK